MNYKLYFILLLLASGLVFGQTSILQNIPQTKTTAHEKDVIELPNIYSAYDFSSSWDIGTSNSTSNGTQIYDRWYSIYKFSLSGVPAGYPIKKVTMTVLITQCDYYSDTFNVKIGQVDNATSLTNAQTVIGAVESVTNSYLSNSNYRDTITVDITNVVGQTQLNDQYFLLGALATDSENNSHAKISLTVNVEYYLPITITADNNFQAPNSTDGKIIINSGSQVDAPKNVPNLIIGNNVSLQAVSPQTDNQGYQRVWNTSGVSTSISYWNEKANNINTNLGNNIQLTHTVVPNDWNATITANLMKVYNITFQNSFIGIGNAGTVIINGTQYNSPTSPFNVVEQNSISGYPDDNYTNNGINYYFDHWSNGSTSASTTFYPGDHTTYTAYYKGTASKSNFNFGFDLLRGQPIKMHLTDNPNPNVSYQVWRTTNYSHGVAQDSTLIATVQKGVQSYTDNEYIFTGLSTDPAIYYDVKEYYSTEGTYSFPSWYTTKGELQPKIASSPNSKKSVESEIKEYSIACYPNPFNPTTTINYQLPKDGVVSIIVFDMLGNKVKILVNGYRTAGSYNISFDASSLPSGIYFYRIQTNNYFTVKKMMLLK